MGSWAKRLDTAVNIAILCAFVMVATLAAKRLFWPESNPHPAIGLQVSVPGVDWSKDNKTLVLALSVGCHFCSDSASFYQRLVPSAETLGIHVLAVLPQPATEARGYLDRLGVSVPEVIQSPLGNLDVSGTPTLLLIDHKGRIKKAWVGKLPPQDEERVVASLR